MSNTTTHLLVGAVAAAAMLAAPAIADPGKGNGNGNGNDNANAIANGGGKGQQEARGNGNGNGNGSRGGNERGNGGPKANERSDRGNAMGNSAEDRRADAPRLVREVRGDDRDYRGDRDRPDYRSDNRAYRRAGPGLIDGCPPGLAKKRNGCLPPGQARKLDQRDTRYRYVDLAPNWWGLRDRRDGRYFYEDGYLLRYDGDRVLGYIPLLGGALTIGNVWPGNYGYYDVPAYQIDYYDLGERNSYRYADNVVYRLDPETAAITSIAALLTGDEFTVGQPAPQGYDVYNVPYSYREQYYDRPGASYRYSDGYVYQIDPETRLVAAAIELLI